MARTKLSSKDFLAELAELSASLRRTIEAEDVGFDPSAAAIAERRGLVADPVTGFEYFVQHYFPHYVRHAARSELHNYLYKRLPEIIRATGSQNDAIAAPRGEAKSTIVSQLFVIWCIVLALKHYPVIIMDSIDRAYPMLEAIKAELQFNPRLLMDFPEATGGGRVWQAGTILTRNDIKVQVAGSGKSCVVCAMARIVLTRLCSMISRTMSWCVTLSSVTSSITGSKNRPAARRRGGQVRCGVYRDNPALRFRAFPHP